MLYITVVISKKHMNNIRYRNGGLNSAETTLRVETLESFQGNSFKASTVPSKPFTGPPPVWSLSPMQGAVTAAAAREVESNERRGKGGEEGSWGKSFATPSQTAPHPMPSSQKE